MHFVPYLFASAVDWLSPSYIQNMRKEMDIDHIVEPKMIVYAIMDDLHRADFPTQLHELLVSYQRYNVRNNMFFDPRTQLLSLCKYADNEDLEIPVLPFEIPYGKPGKAYDTMSNILATYANDLSPSR